MSDGVRLVEFNVDIHEHIYSRDIHRRPAMDFPGMLRIVDSAKDRP